MNTDSQSTRLSDIICILAVLAVCLTGIAGHDLWNPDEPRDAAIALEMANTGDVIIPRLAGVPFVEKPPLYFAASALMVSVFGPVFGETPAIRLTSALFGIGVLIMTFLLGRSLGGIRMGVLAAVILATMEGFVENFHWIRVDAALSFFVIAAIYCFYEIYHKGRYELCLPAGVCLAGSFLSKGLIGPILVSIPWSVLFVSRWFQYKENPVPVRRFLLSHLVLMLAFAGLSGLWILLFYMKGDAALWHEWFWVNHVGRLTGEAVDKGHIKHGEPFYYVIQLLGYGMPWSPLIFAWFGIITVDLFREKHMGEKNLFLYFWGMVSIAVLSLSATKRGIYLTPVLPAFALISAAGMEKGIPKWFRPYTVFWIILSLILITVITFIPLAPSLLPAGIPARVLEELSVFNYYNVISLSGLLACLALIFKYRDTFSEESVLVLVTSVLYISLLGSPMKALDREKGMGDDIRQLVSQIPHERIERLAGTQLSETMLGCFYYYCGLKIPLINDRQAVNSILSVSDTRYDSLITKKKSRTGDETNLADAPYSVRAKIVTGTDASLFWIEGMKPY